ncbi:hypothetical protein [Kribbella soli]|uniref:Uncharacterized protein n=1 Tax=Kribbella soli TaxID=1124743 RepID=A0A4R0H2T0_9ACTN|nr:hypothetical protein [Kribbella soli]TCC04955.1 hypothetical protein E0H45_23015 [Kribbella soli]
MGVDVVLNEVSQQGTSSRRRRLTQLDVVPDPDEVFVRVCARSSLPLLGRVDPYGDLVLTAVEMPQFVAELDQELAGTVTSAEREVLSAVRRLAERCATDACTELQLVGD